MHSVEGFYFGKIIFKKLRPVSKHHVI